MVPKAGLVVEEVEQTDRIRMNHFYRFCFSRALSSSREMVGCFRRSWIKRQNLGLVSRITVSQSSPSTPMRTAVGFPRRVMTTRSSCA